MTPRYLIFSLILIVAFTGCSSLKKKEKQSSEAEIVMDVLKEQSEEIKRSSPKVYLKGVENLEIRFDENSTDNVLDLTCQGASLSALIHHLLKESGMSYFFKDTGIYGTVTANFKNKSLIEAANLILGPSGFFASLDKDVLIIEKKASLPPSPQEGKATVKSKSKDSSDADSDSDSVTTSTKKSFSIEVPLDYIDTKTAFKVLDGLYPKDLVSGNRSVNFGVAQSNSSVFLQGPEQLVREAATSIKQADQRLPHVFIEALVIEYNVDAALEFGIDITNGQGNRYSNVRADIGSLAADAFSFMYTAGAQARNDFTTQFVASIDLLLKNELARIISRPYISTLSGQESKIDITNDRYIVVDTASGGATVTTPKAVSSGVIFSVTPTVLNSELIQMNISVEDSQFVAAAGNIAVEVDKNQASNIMQVRNGEPIVIGGLLSNKKTDVKNGLPIIKDIPFIGDIFAETRQEIQKVEVLIYIVPYIWEPSLVKPLRAEDVLMPGKAIEEQNFLEKRLAKTNLRTA